MAAVPAPPAELLATYNELLGEIQTYLQTVQSQWKGNQTATSFGAELRGADNLTTISPNYYQNYVAPSLRALKGMGVSTVKVQIQFPLMYLPFYQTWSQSGGMTNYTNHLNFYQTMMADAHSLGIKVIAQCDPMPSTGTGVDTDDPLNVTAYYKTLDFSQYVSARSANTVAVAQLSPAPDIVNFDSEPDTEGSKAEQSSLFPTNANFANNNKTLVTSITTALQSAGITGIKWAIGMGTWEQQRSTIMANFLAMPAINIIDIHVHPAHGPNANQDYLGPILTMADQINAAGKSVEMDESWLYKESMAEIGTIADAQIEARDFWSFWAPIDENFIQALVESAYLKNMSYVSFSDPNTFLAYLTYGTSPNCSQPEESCPAATLNTDDNTLVSAAVKANPVVPTDTGEAFIQYTRRAPGVVDVTPPSMPSNLSLSALGQTSFNVSWTPSVDNVATGGYEISVALDPGFVNLLPTYSNFDLGNVVQTTVSGLQAGTGYYVRIVAYDTSRNYSSPSAVVTARTESTGGSQTTVVTTPTFDVSQTRVYPNPWREDRNPSALISIDQFPAGSTVKLFTVSGHLVKTLGGASGSATWDLTNDSGHPVGSGIYLYLVTTPDSQTARGKIAVMR